MYPIPHCVKTADCWANQRGIGKDKSTWTEMRYMYWLCAISAHAHFQKWSRLFLPPYWCFITAHIMFILCPWKNWRIFTQKLIDSGLLPSMICSRTGPSETGVASPKVFKYQSLIHHLWSRLHSAFIQQAQLVCPERDRDQSIPHFHSVNFWEGGSAFGKEDEWELPTDLY